MGQRALFALGSCLLLSGLAGFAIAGDAEHFEPKNVAATCFSTSAAVSWGAVDDAHLSGYDVYKKVSTESSYAKVNPQLVTTTSYTVTGLSSGTTYDFAVMAMYNDGHTSNLSSPARCTAS